MDWNEMSEFPCAGIILAGGLNRRMKGRNKALISIGNQAIIGKQIEVFQELFAHVLVVTNNPLDFLSWGITLVSDLIPVRSSLTGIHAGLFHSRPDQAFISACDMPFLKKEMIRGLIRERDPQVDVVVPVTSAGYQPLCAVYSRRCLKPIEEQLLKGELKISNLFSRVQLKKIPEETLRRIDPELQSFFNINTQEDLDMVQQIRTLIQE